MRRGLLAVLLGAWAWAGLRAEDAPPFRLPRTADFLVTGRNGAEIAVQGVALSADGKFLAPAGPFEDARSAVVADDHTERACLGWLARGDGLIVIKVRAGQVAPARLAAPEFLRLGPTDP